MERVIPTIDCVCPVCTTILGFSKDDLNTINTARDQVIAISRNPDVRVQTAVATSAIALTASVTTKAHAFHTLAERTHEAYEQLLKKFVSGALEGLEDAKDIIKAVTEFDPDTAN